MEALWDILGGQIDVLFALAVGKFGWAPAVLGWLGTLVVVGLGVVAMTPSKKDDEFVGKIYGIPVLGSFLKALAAFSPLQKKQQ